MASHQLWSDYAGLTCNYRYLAKPMKGYRVNIYIKFNQLVNSFLNVSMSISSILQILGLLH